MRIPLLAVVAMLVGQSTSALAQDLTALQEQAFQQAVQRVAPSVVRIETIGGLETIRQGRSTLLVGTGPTTGVIVSEDGYILSSAFNFAQKPASILVGLPDGTRAPAQLVATDHSRMLVLLKVEVREKLTPAEPAPEDEMAVGQWSLAVGRTFSSTEPNVSKGVISALGRIWGRAIQTDAKISPNNYGGPLVGIRGRALGVLVPLSPQSDNKIAGVQWYDSGIGFAIPLVDALAAAEKLKAGEDLHPGILGVSLKPGNQFADPAEIGVVRANGPAYQAGLEPGDKIVEIDGQKIDRQVQVKLVLGPRYAGETVHVAVERDDERIERDIELIATLEPYQRPFLGILPMRIAEAKDAEDEADDEKPAGVTVRYVYPGSGADVAGLRAGDRILAINAQHVADRDDLRAKVAALVADEPAKLKIVRNDTKLDVEVSFGDQPEEVPEKLPDALPERKPYIGPQPPVGKQAVKIDEFANDAFLYVPDGYDPAVAHGAILWFHDNGRLKDDEEVDQAIARFKPHCDAEDLVLVVPRARDPERRKWAPAEDARFVEKLIDQVRGDYNIDDTRIVAHGYESGGSMAYYVGFNQRDLIAGVAAVDAKLAGRPPEHEPLRPLNFFLTKAAAGLAKPAEVDAVAKRLRDMHYPVVLHDQGEKARRLNDEELAKLLRWMDTLDRI